MQSATTPLALIQVWRQAIKLTHQYLLPCYGLVVSCAALSLLATFCFEYKKIAIQLFGPSYGIVAEVLFTAAFLLKIISYSAGILLANKAIGGEPLSLKLALRIAYKKFLKVLFAALALLLMLNIIKVGLGAFIFSSSFPVILMIFCIPLVYLMTIICYSFPNLILSEQGFFVAIKQTFVQIKGHWWRASIAIAIPGLLINFSEVLLIFSKGWLHSTHTISQLVILSAQIPVVLLQAYFSLIILAILFSQWHDLKVRQQSEKMS